MKGNTQVSDDGDLWNSMVGVCRGERRRKRKEVPDGEACTFVGVDRYVPFPHPGPGGRKRREKAA